MITSYQLINNSSYRFFDAAMNIKDTFYLPDTYLETPAIGLNDGVIICEDNHNHRTFLSNDVLSVLGFASVVLFTARFDSDKSASINDGAATTIVINEASDFGVIDSTKVYFIDGVVDMGTTSIEIPSGGINLSGYNFNVSQLISSENNFTLFTSPIGGSGDVLFNDLAFTTSGTSSKLFDIVSDTGFNAIEMNKVNFNDCTSLGVIDTYRQGLELGNGRFGGTPELELKGNWVGGYLFNDSIVRSLTDGSYYLFKAGIAFVMNSRFRSNANIDLPSTAGFVDFAAANFTHSSLLQLSKMLISRNGVFDPDDLTIIPNIDQTEIASLWKNNVGLNNTFVGAHQDITVEIATTFTGALDWKQALGTWGSGNLEHFDVPANGQLRHLGETPRDYQVLGFFTVEGTANDEYQLRVGIYRDATTSFEFGNIFTRTISNSAGGADLAYFSFVDYIRMGVDDYVFLEVANRLTGNSATIKLSSCLHLYARN